MNKTFILTICICATIFCSAIFALGERARYREYQKAYAYGAQCEKMGISTNLNPYKTSHEKNGWLEGWYQAKKESSGYMQ